MKKNNNIYMIVFIFSIMALIAIADTAKGVLTPIFISDFNVTNTKIGFMFSVCSLGYIIFTYFGGRLCEKMGQKNVFLLGIIFNILSLIIIAISKTYSTLVLGMFIMNIGIPFIAISVNTLIPVVFSSYQAVIMNITHCCFGVGATLASLIVGGMISFGSTWKTIYIGIAIVFCVILVYFMFIDIPTVKKAENQVKINSKKIFKDKYIYLYGIGLGSYVFAETNISNWFTNFLQENYNFNTGKSSMYLTMFLLLFTVGRLLGGFVAEKKGYFKSVQTSLVIAIILLISALAIGKNALILICISGLFFAITFPTIVLTIGKVFKENVAYVTGIIITFASFINMIMSFVMGRLNDLIGTSSAFYMIPISLIVSVIFVTIIDNRKKHTITEVGNMNG